jgi:hypothetical protein
MNAMWDLFVAIGDFWQLRDDSSPYKLRLQSFMANRIAFNPLYSEFYAVAARVLSELIAAHGAKSAYEQFFTQKPRTSVNAPPETELEFVQQYVANEFIALRLALGGFKAFGAINYRGYFGGANISGQPVPFSLFMCHLRKEIRQSQGNYGKKSQLRLGPESSAAPSRSHRALHPNTSCARTRHTARSMQSHGDFRED